MPGDYGGAAVFGESVWVAAAGEIVNRDPHEIRCRRLCVTCVERAASSICSSRATGTDASASERRHPPMTSEAPKLPPTTSTFASSHHPPQRPSPHPHIRPGRRVIPSCGPPSSLPITRATHHTSPTWRRAWKASLAPATSPKSIPRRRLLQVRIRISRAPASERCGPPDGLSVTALARHRRAPAAVP